MKTSAKMFVVCLKNKGYEVSLEPRKIYQVLPDPDAAKHRQPRVCAFENGRAKERAPFNAEVDPLFLKFLGVLGCARRLNKAGMRDER